MSNILTKSETQWKVHSNELLKKELLLRNQREESDSIFLMSNFMLMLFTEEELKSSQQLEEYTMHVKSQPIQDSKNQFTFVILLHLQML